MATCSRDVLSDNPGSWADAARSCQHCQSAYDMFDDPHICHCYLRHARSNDAFDAAMGVDVAKPESVVNLTGNRTAVLWAANAFLAAGLCTFAGSLIVPVRPGTSALLEAWSQPCDPTLQPCDPTL